jgi:hypothetical protein
MFLLNIFLQMIAIDKSSFLEKAKRPAKEKGQEEQLK